MSADPLHSRLVHSIHASLSERGRRWPFRMSISECIRTLTALSDDRLNDLLFAAGKGDRGYFLAKLKEAGIQ